MTTTITDIAGKTVPERASALFEQVSPLEKVWKQLESDFLDTINQAQKHISQDREVTGRSLEVDKGWRLTAKTAREHAEASGPHFQLLTRYFDLKQEGGNIPPHCSLAKELSYSLKHFAEDEYDYGAGTLRLMREGEGNIVSYLERMADLFDRFANLPSFQCPRELLRTPLGRIDIDKRADFKTAALSIRNEVIPLIEASAILKDIPDFAAGFLDRQIAAEIDRRTANAREQELESQRQEAAARVRQQEADAAAREGDLVKRKPYTDRAKDFGVYHDAILDELNTLWKPIHQRMAGQLSMQGQNCTDLASAISVFKQEFGENGERGVDLFTDLKESISKLSRDEDLGSNQISGLAQAKRQLDAARDVIGGLKKDRQTFDTTSRVYQDICLADTLIAELQTGLAANRILEDGHNFARGHGARKVQEKLDGLRRGAAVDLAGYTGILGPNGDNVRDYKDGWGQREDDRRENPLPLGNGRV